ncbi:hypothetical protein ACB092_10G065400 [Castanea dentata]
MNPRSLTFNRRSCDGAVRVPSSSTTSSSSYYRSMQTFPPERHADLVRRRGGLITVPRRIAPAPETCGGSQSPRLTKLLLNVTIERSLGPIHVVIPPENKVRDLTKTALEIYAREKRRPLLPETDPHCFELHYSQFSLESLKPEEKLINLGSRNFFLCYKPSSSAGSSCSKEAKKAINTAFPLTKLMDFLL